MMKLVTFAALALAGSTAAQAAETIYNSRVAFDAATTGATVDTFGTGGGSAFVGPTYVRSGYSATASDGWMFNNNPSVDNNYYNWGTGNTVTFKQNASVTFTFDAPVTAFGIDLGTFFQNFPQPTQYNFSVAVATPGAEYNVNMAATKTLTFFGLTSTTGFTSITLTGGNNFTVFDNVTLATALVAPVPESATWAMMILGFGIAGAGIRARRSSAKTVLA